MLVGVMLGGLGYHDIAQPKRVASEAWAPTSCISSSMIIGYSVLAW